MNIFDNDTTKGNDMSEVDKLILLTKETATMKMRMEIINVIDLELEKLRAQIKEMEKSDDK